MSKTVNRIFSIIKILGRSSQGVTFSEIQKLIDIPKSSLHNILKELQEENIIDFNEQNKAYYVSNEFNRIAAVCLSNINLLSQINTEVSSLSFILDETVHAGILSERFVTYVAKAEGPSKVSTIDSIGMSVPAHCSAMGKVLLTMYTNEELEKLFSDVQLEKYTDNTIVDFEVLKEELVKVKRNGYSYECGEISAFAACIAAPIYKYNKIVAAISITVPIHKLTEEYKYFLLKHLQSTVTQISDNLSLI